MPSAPCSHDHLVFKDGTHAIECVDCDTRWETKDLSQHGNLLLALRSSRHDRFVLPRTTKAEGKGKGG